MKKILIILISIFSICSCHTTEKEYEATITYNIHYPNKIVTRTYTYDCYETPGYILYSQRGTNYLDVETDDTWPGYIEARLETTSAPIEVVSFTKRKK